MSSFGGLMNIDAVTVEVAKLELKPGDVLAIKCNMILSTDMLRDIHELLKRELPDRKILILDKHFDLVVVPAPA